MYCICRFRFIVVILIGTATLRVQLQPQNKTVVNVASDGNCLFSALALQLQCGDGLAVSHYDVRQNLVKYLRDHPEVVCTGILWRKLHVP